MRYLRTGTGIVWLALCAVLMVSIWGCSGERDGGVAPAYRKEVNSSANRGSLVVSLDKTAITTVDPVHLELVAEVPVGVSAVFPAPGSKWKQWTVVEVSIAEREILSGGEVRERKVYTLEPFLAGDYLIPAFSVKFVEPGKEAVVVKVEAIPVTVATVLEGDPETMELADPYAEVVPQLRWVWWIAGGAIGILAILGGWVFISLRRPVASDNGPPDPRRVMVAELDGMIRSETVDAARLSAIAGRVSNLPEGFGERIEGLAFSELEAGDESVRGAAVELREILVGKKKGGGG